MVFDTLYQFYALVCLSVRTQTYYKRNEPVNKCKARADYVAEVFVLASQSPKHAPTTPTPLIGSEKTRILDPSYELMKKSLRDIFSTKN